MTRAYDGPRTGSRAYVALEALHSIGGQADLATWMKASAWSPTVLTFSCMVIDALERGRHVFKRGQLFIITDRGTAHIGKLDVSVVTPVEMASGRYVPPMRPLSARHLPNLRPMRDGAFDYRNIPSLHGDERVAFQSSLKVAGVGAE